MKKNAIKYLIAALLFVDICTIAVIGLLLAFVIPEGQTGRASKYFLGLHRHVWGDLHLSLSVVLLLLLALHLWFNWTWIVQSSKRYLGTNWKKVLWCLSGAWILVLIACIAIKLWAL
jgi:hypothetical protein